MHRHRMLHFHRHRRASLAVAIGGGVLLLGGIGGGISSGIALANLYDEKRNLLVKQKRLESGVQLLTACSAGLADLGTQAGGVATALQNTTNSWTFLKGSLNSAADNIEKAGRTQSDFLRKTFLRTIDKSLPRNLEQLRNTRKALIGMETVSQPNTHTGDLIRFQLQQPRGWRDDRAPEAHGRAQGSVRQLKDQCDRTLSSCRIDS